MTYLQLGSAYLVSHRGEVFRPEPGPSFVKNLARPCPRACAKARNRDRAFLMSSLEANSARGEDRLADLETVLIAQIYIREISSSSEDCPFLILF